MDKISYIFNCTPIELIQGLGYQPQRVNNDSIFEKEFGDDFRGMALICENSNIHYNYLKKYGQEYKLCLMTNTCHQMKNTFDYVVDDVDDPERYIFINFPRSTDSPSQEFFTNELKRITE